MAGLILLSSKATVERSVIRDTREDALSKEHGIGLWVGSHSLKSRRSVVSLSDSLLVGNHTVAISLLSSKATVERTVVRDTRVQASDNRYGRGIEVEVQHGHSAPSELVLRDSLVASNHDVGIGLFGSKGSIERSAISDTRQDADGKRGDGLVAAEKTMLHAKHTLVERSLRAGFLFDDAGGSIHGSLIRRNVFTIDLEKGASPTIGVDNQMVDNQVNRVTFGQKLNAPRIPSIPNL